MGYGIMAYAVRIEYLKAPSTFASEPPKFFDWMADVHASTIDSPARRTALRELFFGMPHTGADGADYGYALKVLCERFGGALDNDHWYPLSSAGMGLIGEELARLGVTFQPEADLVFAGAPVALPAIDDFPVVGHLTSAEMEKLATVLESADLNLVEDARTRGAIAEFKSWLHDCAEDGSDLVTFYH